MPITQSIQHRQLLVFGFKSACSGSMVFTWFGTRKSQEKTGGIALAAKPQSVRLKAAKVVELFLYAAMTESSKSSRTISLCGNDETTKVDILC